jgi:hypothetical protein
VPRAREEERPGDPGNALEARTLAQSGSEA